MAVVIAYLSFLSLSFLFLGLDSLLHFSPDIVCIWLFPHHLFTFLCLFLLTFLLSSIYGFQFQVSGVLPLLLLLSSNFFSWAV